MAAAAEEGFLSRAEQLEAGNIGVGATASHDGTLPPDVDPESGAISTSAIAKAITPTLQTYFTETASLSGLAGIVESVIPAALDTNWYGNLGGAAAASAGSMIARGVIRHFDPEGTYVSDVVADATGSAVAGGVTAGLIASSIQTGLIFGGLAAGRVVAGVALDAIGSSATGHAPLADAGTTPASALPSAYDATKIAAGALAGGIASGLVKAVMGGGNQAVQTGVLVGLFFLGLRAIFTAPHLKTQLRRFFTAGTGAMGVVDAVAGSVPPTYSKAALLGADRAFPGVVGVALVANMTTNTLLMERFGWTPEKAGMVSAIMEATFVGTIGTEILAAVNKNPYGDNLAVTIPFVVGILVNQTPQLIEAIGEWYCPSAPAATASGSPGEARSFVGTLTSEQPGSGATTAHLDAPITVEPVV